MNSAYASSLSALWKALSLASRERMLFATWGTFLVAGAISYWVEFAVQKHPRSIRSFLNYCFPWRDWKSASARVDVVLYFIGKGTDRLIGGIGLVLVGVLSVYVSRYLDAAFSSTARTNGGVLDVLILGCLFFLAVDFANYTTHLMEHKIPLLWEFHKVHHSASFLSPLTTARFHPLEKMIDSVFSSLFVGLIAGVAKHFYNFSVAELLGIVAAGNAIATLAVLDSLRHSQFPVSFGLFDRVILSPHMHQLHHSVKLEHWDKNMGNKLSIWDWCFRTGFKPDKGEALGYGTGQSEDTDYESVLNCYILPIVKSYRLCKQSLGTESAEVDDTQPIQSVQSTQSLSQLPQTESFMD